MSSLPIQGNEEVIEEIKTNFDVIYSMIKLLYKELNKEKFLTSYEFISENIINITKYIRSELPEIEEQSRRFEKTSINSPLQIAFYKNSPEIIFTYRNNVREFSDQIRRQIDTLSINIGKSLAGYILVYETLEKFGFKNPFILIESNDFMSQKLINYVFNEFDSLGTTQIQHKKCDAYIITYSGMEIANPLSLLIIGHEAFHIINENDQVFHNFCVQNSIKENNRTEEAFIDIMSDLYFGPVYSNATLKYFQKTYPLSGSNHPEMNIRLSTLSQINSELNIGDNNLSQITDFTKILENRMSSLAKENAEEDKKKLQEMISKQVVIYIKKYFEQKGIKTYDEFKNVVEKREFEQDIEKYDRDKIIYLLNHNIPLALRPTTILNTLNDSDNLDKVDSKLITSSFKKWYVRRYYNKSIEKQKQV